MPNPAALVYETYRTYMHEHGKTEVYLLPWDQLSEEHQKAWWEVVRILFKDKESGKTNTHEQRV